MEWDESQKRAIAAAVGVGDCIITGGAGTGKTTLIKEIASKFPKGVKLLAPTGKAAARLKEATGYYAETIHRFLGYNGESFFQIEPCDIPIIVDESSMIDSWLMAKLLETRPPKIILVGDAAQLPPVGKGQPFHDMIAMFPGRVHTLEVCHRAQAAIHKAALAIRAGQAPEAKDKTVGPDGKVESFRLIETGGPITTQKRIVEWVDGGWFDPTTDIILSPRHGDEDSDGDIRSINAKVQAIVNPHHDGERWKVGDRVINGKNNSESDIWNGDIATVVDVDDAGWPFLQLDRERKQGVLHARKEIQASLTPAYCLSIHKSQGSQFRRVFVICLGKHVRMLSRSLIYTAVTRAREGCVVVGEMKAFYKGISTVQTKHTYLQYVGRNVAQ